MIISRDFVFLIIFAGDKVQVKSVFKAILEVLELKLL